MLLRLSPAEATFENTFKREQEGRANNMEHVKDVRQEEDGAIYWA